MLVAHVGGDQRGREAKIILLFTFSNAFFAFCCGVRGSRYAGISGKLMYQTTWKGAFETPKNLAKVRKAGDGSGMPDSAAFPLCTPSRLGPTYVGGGDGPDRENKKCREGDGWGLTETCSVAGQTPWSRATIYGVGLCELQTHGYWRTCKFLLFGSCGAGLNEMKLSGPMPVRAPHPRACREKQMTRCGTKEQE